MSTIVTLDMTASEETREQAISMLTEALDTTRQYAGCEGLELVVNQDKPNNFMLYERWSTRDHYEKYRAWRQETGFSAEFRALFPESPEIRIFDLTRTW